MARHRRERESHNKKRGEYYRSALAELTRDPICTEGTLAEAMRLVCFTTSRCLSAARVTVWLLSDDGEDLHALAEHDSRAAQAEHGYYPPDAALRACDHAPYLAALRSESMLAISDAAEDRRVAAVYHRSERGVGAVLDLIAYRAGRPAAVLQIDHVGGHRAWSAEERTFATAVAGFIGQRLAADSTQQTIAGLSSLAERERMLRRVLEAALSARSRTAFLDRAVELCGVAAEVSRVAFWLQDRDGDGLGVAHEWCAPGIPAQRSVLQGVPYHAMPRYLERLRTGATVVCSNTHRFECPSAARILASVGVLAFVSTPVFLDRRYLGFITLEDCRRFRSWCDADLQSITALGTAVSQALSSPALGAAPA